MNAFKLERVILMALSLVLIGCAKAPSPRNLEVSNSFVIGSNGFTGGLVVVGEGPAGAKFVSTAASGLSVNISLVNGTWNFYLVGWDGAEKFKGEVHCAAETIVLDSNTTDIYLKVNTANCANSAFTIQNKVTTNALGFKPINLHTCGVLSDTFTVDSNQDDLDEFCGLNVPDDLKLQAKSIKFSVLGTTLSSDCASTDLIPFGTGLKIPTNKIPIQAEVFQNKNCNGDSLTYDFPKGLYSGSPGADTVLISDFPLDNALLIATTVTKRGNSPLLGLLPSMRCMGDFCPPNPDASGSPSLFISGGTGGRTSVVISRDPQVSCDDVNVFFRGASGGGIANNPNSCESHDDVTYLRISEHYEKGCAGTGFCSIPGHFDQPSCVDDLGTWFFGYCKDTGPTNTNNTCPGTGDIFSPYCFLKYEIKGFPKVMIVQSDVTQHKSLNDDLYRVLGGKPSAAMHYNSTDVFDGETFSYGSLRNAREMLGTDGPLGVFGDTPCDEIDGVKTVSTMDEGKIQLYQIIGKNSSKTIPSGICSNANKNPAICSPTSGGQTKFDKQIIAREFVNGYQTTLSMHLSCTNKIGMLESQEKRSEDGEYVIRKELLIWNTQDETASRFEKYSYEQEFVGNTPTNEKKLRMNFERGEKQDSSKYSVVTQDYHRERISGDYIHRLFKREIAGESASIYGANLGLEMTTTDPAANIFNSPYGRLTKRLPRIDFKVDVSGTPALPLLMDSPQDNFHYDEYLDNGDLYQAIVYRKSEDLLSIVVGKNGNFKPEVSFIAADASWPRVSLSALGDARLVWFKNIGDGDILVADYDFENNSVSGTQTIVSDIGSYVSNLAVSNGLVPIVMWTVGNSLSFSYLNSSIWADGSETIIGAFEFYPKSLKTYIYNGETKIAVMFDDGSNPKTIYTATYVSGPSQITFNRASSSHSLAVESQPHSFDFFKNGNSHYYTWEDNMNPSLNFALKANLGITSQNSHTNQTPVQLSQHFDMGRCYGGGSSNGIYGNPGTCGSVSFGLPMKPQFGIHRRLDGFTPTLFNSIFTNDFSTID